MKVVSFINSKGGVGKTTLCVNLAVEMQKHLYVKDEKHKDAKELKLKNAKVLLVDADPQGTARDWHEISGYPLIDLIVLDRKQALYHLNKMDLPYDYVFIDTPAGISDICTSALILSDLVIVPIQPSPYDIWSVADTIEVIKQRQEITSGVQPKGYFVLNRCIPNANICKDAKEYLHKSAFPHFITPVYQRVIYAEAAAHGNTVFEYGNELAIQSIIQLGDEIRGVLENVNG